MPLNADAAGQATFYGCFDKVGCEEGDRDPYVDLPKAAILARAKLSNVGYPLRVASGEFGEQILIAILPQKLQQVGKSLAKQRDMGAHDLAGLRRVAAKDRHHNLFVFGDR